MLLMFYRGAVESAWNQIEPAEKDLRAAILAAPHSADAYEARELLTHLYFRNGLYREALSELDAMLAEKPDAKDERSLFATLGHADQIARSKKASTISGRMDHDNLFLPIKVQGKKAEYIMDSGANLSIMSESEAKRFGLKIHSISTPMSGISGKTFGFRVAMVKDMRIGDLHLKNVAFGVMSDSQEPFVDLPKGSRGILGISVMLAMKTIRFRSDGKLTLGFASEALNSRSSGIAFEESTPLTLAAFQGQQIIFTLDTGADHTVLYPPFASKFPALIKNSGNKESYNETGLDGKFPHDSVLLPSVTFNIGGYDATLKPAHVLTKHSTGAGDWAVGNLGMDLLDQAKVVTLDFQNMSLTLQ